MRGCGDVAGITGIECIGVVVVVSVVDIDTVGVAT